MVTKKLRIQNGSGVFTLKLRQSVAGISKSTAIMFLKFGNLFKKDRRAEDVLPAFSLTPHGPREERLIAAISEEAAKKLIAATRTGETASWSPEDMDVSGIVLCASDDEVRTMICARVVARTRHFADVEVTGQRVTAAPSVGLFITGDTEIAAARQQAIAGMSAQIAEVAEGISARISAAVQRDGAAAYDLTSFSPHRSMTWPLEGWDRESLRAAGEAVMGRVRQDLEGAGLTVVLRNGKFEVSDPEPNPSL